MTADVMIALFLRHLPQVVSVAADPGPFVYHLTRERLTKMTLDCGASGTPPHHTPAIS
jgi:hypothetical protein